MKFSIVIPTYNRAEKLEFVLPTIANQDFPKEEFEIILSDSGSTDNTKEIVDRLSIPNLRMITGENRGRSGARNRGALSAKGEYILFTDADILATGDLLSEHLKFHDKYENCAVVGREVRVDTLEEYEKARVNPDSYPTLHPPHRKRLSWLYFLTGNASALRKTLVDVGIFDEDFTGYGHEDLELGYRLEKAGVEIYYNKDAVNYHWHPVEFEQECERRLLAGISTVRFYKKHKDPAIKLKLGWNPFNFAWQGLTSNNGPFIRWMKKKSGTCNFCREVVLQHYWISGIKQGLNEL
ncbi:MAG: glycosyltransferase [Candidatus Eremiobacteraeota bacterium]|nr:glycosyltransferase [Candidatus Eremiobacteraeota bacterium]